MIREISREVNFPGEVLRNLLEFLCEILLNVLLPLCPLIFTFGDVKGNCIGGG